MNSVFTKAFDTLWFTVSQPFVSDIVKTCLSTFVGALFAFQLNQWQEQRKQHNAQSAYLLAAIADIIDNTLNLLLLMKSKLILPKIEEINNIEPELTLFISSLSQGTKDTFFELAQDDIKALLTCIVLPDFDIHFDVKQLSFIASKNIDALRSIYYFVSHIKKLNLSMRDLDLSLNEINTIDKDKFESTYEPLMLQRLISQTKNFCKHTDSTIFWANKTQELLFEYGMKVYGNRFMYKSITMPNKYRELTPTGGIEMPEGFGKWPRKKNIYEKILRVFNKDR